MRVFLSIGANLGNPRETIQQAWQALQKNPHLRNFKSSRCYLTAPVSDIPQPDYINCVWSMQTDLDPLPLMETLQEVERSLGKLPKPKNAPRFLDIDILFYGNTVMQTDTLEIPHPRLFDRAFVLVPLAEITDSIPLPYAGETNVNKLIMRLPQETLKDVKPILDWSLS